MGNQPPKKSKKPAPTPAVLGPHILVGPVVGAVGCNSARLLWESSESADVNIRLTDNGDECAQLPWHLEGPGKPAVFEFTTLEPGHTYTATLEGLVPLQTAPFARFRTSEADKSGLSLAVVSCNKVYFDSVTRKRADLWGNYNHT